MQPSGQIAASPLIAASTWKEGATSIGQCGGPNFFNSPLHKKKLELLLSTSLEFKLLNYLDSQIE